MRDFVIYTDSACDIPPETLAEWGVGYSSLTYTFEGDERQYDNYELDYPAFYDRVRRGGVARTSAVNAETFRRMKKSAYLINCARGGLVDEDALVEALKSGEIAGAGLDTITSEHPTPDMPIFSCENAILTPHAAWYSVECDRDLLVEAARNCADSLLGKPMGTLCNPELLK